MSANPTTAKRGKKVPITESGMPTNEEVKVAEATAEAVPEDKYVQLFSKTGEVMYTSRVLKSTAFTWNERDQVLIDHLPEIIRQAQDIEDFDTSQLDLSDTNFSQANLRNIHLAGADLSGCNFNDTDLRSANLRDCDLIGCAFDNTRLTGADLTGADLRDTSFSHVEARDVGGLILLCDLNDYFMYGYRRTADDVVRVRAGCRDFTLEEAHDHWDRAGDRLEIRAGLALIEAVARNRGWRIKEGDVSKDPKMDDGPGDEEEDEDDL